ncbi:ParB N-terminal domain-containing protein [Actinomycetospora sp. Odt1-22]|uniref:ParB N-terminal domain-containing protein n=1 Tax=Actinomycetospora termitidis TaxID=3053470 RepID=A0ABT7MFK1_9PSEU|nr:ParB N-terminal domain-containing protein [Actinomycetospora sp. Odt1-22]
MSSIPISKLYGSHSPDEHRVKPWRGSCPPITVERNGRRYRLVDGASRVESARRAGARTIRAEVWETA